MSGAPCCELCKLVWNLCWAVQVGVESVNCCVFCLAQTQPSFAFSCLRFCRVSCFAIWEMQLQAVVLLLQMKLWGLFSKVFFCKLFGKLQVLKGRSLKYFLPCRIVAEIMQQVHQSQQIAAAQLAAQPPVPGPGSVAPPPTATSRWVRRCNAPPADGSAGVIPMAGATAPADGSAGVTRMDGVTAPAADGTGVGTAPAPLYVRQCLKCGEMSYFREGCCLNSKCEAWPCLAFFFSMWGGYGSMF